LFNSRVVEEILGKQKTFQSHNHVNEIIWRFDNRCIYCTKCW